MVHPHEQEELDHDLDNATELQNALALSRLENPSSRDPRIGEAITLGLWVVVLCITRYCPRTDAILGIDRVFHSSHRVQEDAQHVLNRLASDDDRWHEVEGPRPTPTEEVEGPTPF